MKKLALLAALTAGSLRAAAVDTDMPALARHR